MARRIGSLYVNFTARVGEYVRGLRQAQTAQQRFNVGLRRLRTRIIRLNRTAADLPRILFRQRTALLALVGAGGVGVLARQYIQATDALDNVASRLTIVTDSTAELESVQRRLFDISQQTRSDFVATANSYARLAQAGRQAGIATADLLRLQKTLNQTFIISGSSAQEAAAASIQFAQGMASGKLQGDELRSVLEGNVRLAQALSDAFGVNVGVLRDIAAEGALNVSSIVEGLAEQVPQIEREFALISVTVEQAVQRLQNDMLTASRTIQTATDSTGTLIDAIERLREVVRDRENIQAFGNLIAQFVDLLAWIVENAENIARSLKTIAIGFTVFSAAVLVAFPALGFAGFVTSIFRASRAGAALAKSTAAASAATAKAGAAAAKSARQVDTAAKSGSRFAASATAIGRAVARADRNTAALGATAIVTSGIVIASWEDTTRRVRAAASEHAEYVNELRLEYEKIYGTLGSTAARLAEVRTELESLAQARPGDDIFGGLGGVAGVGVEQDQAQLLREQIDLQKILGAEEAARIFRYAEMLARLREEERRLDLERDRSLGKFADQREFAIEASELARRRVAAEQNILAAIRAQQEAVSARLANAQAIEASTARLIVEAGTEAALLDAANEKLEFQESIAGRRLDLESRIREAESQRGRLVEAVNAAYARGETATAKALSNLLASAIAQADLARIQKEAYESNLPLEQEAFELAAAKTEQIRKYNAEVARSSQLLEAELARIGESFEISESPVSGLDRQVADAQRQLQLMGRAASERTAANAALEAQAEIVAEIDALQKQSLAKEREILAVEEALQAARDDAQRKNLVLTGSQVDAYRTRIEQLKNERMEIERLASERQQNFDADLEHIQNQEAVLQETLERLERSGTIDSIRSTLTTAFRGFANSILTDFDNIENAARRLGQTIISAIFDRIVAQRLAAGIGSLFDSIIFGSSGGSVNSFAPGFRMAGGPVSARTPYIVGEGGPELFIPQVAGSIVPNNRLGPNGGVTIVYAPRISGSDADTVRRVLEADKPRFIKQVQSEMNLDMSRPSQMSRIVQRRA